MSIIQTQSKTVAQFASGLYGYALGVPTNNAVLAEAGLSGLNSVFNSYYAQTFSALSADSVARVVVSNVGIVAGQNGLTTAIVNEAVTYVKNALTAAAATGTQGQVVASLLIGFSNMAADPVFGAAARAWNTQVDKDMAYTSSGALLDVPTALAIVPTPPTPTYAVDVNQESIAEGGAVTYTIRTTNVAAGTDVGYSVSGTNNAQTANKSGLATVNEQGFATVTVTTTDNSVVGDTGTLTFTVVSGATTLATADAVTVVSEDDAVVVPTYSVTASDITEGGTATFHVVTTGVAAGTDIAYTIVGSNNASGTHSGLVRIGLDGTGTVTLETAENETPADAGELEFTLGASLATETVIVSNNDGNEINNTYDLTSGENNISDTNGGNDTFIGSIGDTSLTTTLTSDDDLNGGTGTNTLHIDVVEDDAELPEMDGNTSSFVKIQNIELDLTRNELYNGEDGEDELADFSTEYFDDSTGSLKKVTQIITSDSGTSSFADVLVHKDLTLVFQGSGVEDYAEDLNETIFLKNDAEELTKIDIVLDGVGGDDSWLDFAGESYDDGGTYYHDNDTLKTITVTGNLSVDPYYGAEASLGLHSHALYTDGDWYTDEGSLNALNEIIVSLDDTNAKDIIVSFDGDNANDSYYGEDGGEDYQNQILWNVTNLDFSGSTANIATYGEDAIRKTDFDAASVEIKYGAGDDVLELDIGYSQAPEWNSYAYDNDDYDGSYGPVYSSAVRNKESATQINIDMGKFTDNNLLILTEGGNIDSANAPNDNGDLLEDMIVVKNWDIQEDTLQLANFTMHLGDTDEYGEVGEDNDSYWGYYAWLDELDFVNTTEVQDAVADVVLANTNSNNGLYNVVDAVADYLASKLYNDYGFVESDSEDEILIADNAAAFVFKGDTYVYVDTDRTYDDNNDSEFDYEYNNIGLSAGDTLIKFTGITSLNMANITSYDNFDDTYGGYVYTDFNY